MVFDYIHTMCFISVILLVLLVQSPIEATSRHAPNILTIKPNEPDPDSTLKTIAFSIINPIGPVVPDPNSLSKTITSAMINPNEPDRDRPSVTLASSNDSKYSKLARTSTEMMKPNKPDGDKTYDPTIEFHPCPHPLEWGCS